ncbi:helix-turn-helix domain-containing protein [Planomonospora sp. ID82291]|uniref:helix-turn-helix domain-containing protein n=1 Tax=Planomonospora sp. ID82291 TaxID=2738136 RepID=UPI001E57EA6A|nr:helix-turn-helix domain-containing protein [Planomonospora sp. ID82291]
MLSWAGMRGPAIAEQVGCHPETVRRRLHRFNAEGLDGLGDRPGSGRKPRLTQAERSQIIALAKSTPPGRLRWRPWGELEADDETGPAVWTGRAHRRRPQERHHRRPQPGPPDPVWPRG